MLSKSIEEAKKELEKKIIFVGGVFGIGTIFDGKDSFIEISVRDTYAKSEISKIVPENKWQGHPVKIIIRDQTIR
jgi:hypothetical protein